MSNGKLLIRPFFKPYRRAVRVALRGGLGAPGYGTQPVPALAYRYEFGCPPWPKIEKR